MADLFGYAADPARPGWLVRGASDDNRFLDVYGDMAVRVESDGRARLRLTPAMRHCNALGTVHGGFLLALVDHALFIGPGALGIEGAASGVTLDVSTQFLAPVLPDQPIDVLIEVLRDTYRMTFMRGTIEQNDVAALAFSGTIRKASPAS
jgi:uncharacterized protein (TIGR00369 family)